MAFTLDQAGGAEVLKVIAADAIKELADQLAAAVGDTAIVELTTTDRAKARVKVPADAQAKDGVLTKAAADIGLEVRPSKKRPPRPPRVRKGKAESARTANQNKATKTAKKPKNAKPTPKTTTTPA